MNVFEKIRGKIEFVKEYDVLSLDEKQRLIDVYKEIIDMLRGEVIVWISCSERLPELETAVLFTNKIGQVGIGRLSEAGNWYISESDGGRYIVSAVAWMPLPEPYMQTNRKTGYASKIQSRD